MIDLRKAKYGDCFQTQDGSMAMYVKHVSDGWHMLMVEKEGNCNYYDDGSSRSGNPDLDLRCKEQKTSEMYQIGR